MQRLWIGLDGLAGFGAVAMAALAAHALPGRLGPASLAMVRSAVQMQGWHALALLACGLWTPRGGRLADWAATAFVLGMISFCSGVYTLAFTGVALGPAAPAGGMLLMLGWLLLAASALRAR